MWPQDQHYQCDQDALPEIKTQKLCNQETFNGKDSGGDNRDWDAYVQYKYSICQEEQATHSNTLTSLSSPYAPTWSKMH